MPWSVVGADGGTEVGRGADNQPRCDDIAQVVAVYQCILYLCTVEYTLLRFYVGTLLKLLIERQVVGRHQI